MSRVADALLSAALHTCPISLMEAIRVSEPQEKYPLEGTEEESSSEKHPNTMEIALSKESDSSEESDVPVYDERLHFRYFVMYNRRGWLLLVFLVIAWFVWQFASNLAANVNEGQSINPVTPPVEPADEISRSLMDVVNIIITGIVEAITNMFEALAGSLSVPVGTIGTGLVVIVVIVAAVLTFRSWVAWTHSRLTVKESGVQLVEGDIPWLFIPGRVQNLHPSVVNDLAKSRDILDQLIFWNCWQASILSFEQTGSHDEIQDVPVRGVDRLQRSVRALAAHHNSLKGQEERTTNQLLTEAVEELRRLRASQSGGGQEEV